VPGAFQSPPVPRPRESSMNSRYAVALSTLAGVAIGAVSVGGLYAQGKAPGAYVVVAFSDLQRVPLIVAHSLNA